MNVLEQIRERAQNNLKKVVFPEAEDVRVLKAVKICETNKYVIPVLVGTLQKVKDAAAEAQIDISNITIVDPATDDNKQEFINFIHRNMDRYDIEKTIKTTNDEKYDLP